MNPEIQELLDEVEHTLLLQKKTKVQFAQEIFPNYTESHRVKVHRWFSGQSPSAENLLAIQKWLNQQQ